MTRAEARKTARDILDIVPLVMRIVAAQLRSAGGMPAPAHFGVLSLLHVRPRRVTDLASIQGVSLPTMSNSISTMVERGWVRRGGRESDRRVVMIEVTAGGRAALARVGRSAQAHLADALAPLNRASRRRLQDGLDVLQQVFASGPPGQRRGAEQRRRRARL
jgi:DNA-binding MarR family transcriptional regulator